MLTIHAHNHAHTSCTAGRESASPELQEAALEGLLDLCRCPGFLHAVYLSCDCRVERRCVRGGMAQGLGAALVSLAGETWVMLPALLWQDQDRHRGMDAHALALAPGPSTEIYTLTQDATQSNMQHDGLSLV